MWRRQKLSPIGKTLMNKKYKSQLAAMAIPFIQIDFLFIYFIYSHFGIKSVD